MYLRLLNTSDKASSARAHNKIIPCLYSFLKSKFYLHRGKMNRNLQDISLFKNYGFLIFLSALVFLFGGLIIYGAPPLPDEVMTSGHYFGSLFVFVFWLLSIFAWGEVLCWLFKIDSQFLFPAVPFGTAFMALVAGLLGHVGLIGIASIGIFQIVGLVGPCLFWFLSVLYKRNNNLLIIKEKIKTLSFYEKLALGTIAIILSLSFMQSNLMSSFWDPLWYHLVGPRFWTDQGKIFFSKTSLIAFQANAWEYLFIWGNSLLTSPNGGGLIVGQLWGQWTHVILGYCVSGSALYYFFKSMKIDRNWCLIAVVAGISTLFLHYSIAIAKNDWGTISWTLTGLWFLNKTDDRKIKNLFFGGLFVGLAFSSKFTSIFSLFPLCALWLFNDCKNSGWQSALKNGLFVLLMIFIGASPILLRNYFATGNPLFPSMNEVFPTPFAGPTWTKAFEDWEGRWFGFGGWNIFLTEMGRWGYFIWPVILIPIMSWKRKQSSILLPLFFVLLGSLALFICKVGKYVELRNIGTMMMIASAMGTLAIIDCFNSLKDKPKSVWLAILPLVIFLFLGPTLWEAPLRLVEVNNPSVQIREFAGGGSLAWLREHMNENQTAVSLADPRIYYLSHKKVAIIWDYPELDKAITGSRSALEMVQVLRRFNIDFLFNTIRPIDNYYSKELVAMMMAAMDQHPDAIVFTGNTSKVVDLKKLETALTKN